MEQLPTSAGRDGAVMQQARRRTQGAGQVIERPTHWVEPFDPDMSDATVDEILSMAPFCDMDPQTFPPSLPLRGIVRNDMRIRHFQPGDVVVRKGQYGNSAFLIASGAVRVALEQEGSVLDEIRGHEMPARKGFFQAFAQLWRNSKGVEFRDPALYENLDMRETPHADIRIFLQDVPAIIGKYHTKRMDPGEFFGEISALGRTPYTATVFAEKESRLLEIQWDGLMNLRRYAVELREHIDKIYRERSLYAQLQATPILRHLTPEQIAQLANQTQFLSYGEFDWYGSYKQMLEKSAEQRLAQEPVMAQEGDYPNGLILIRSGFTRLSHRFGHGHRTITYLGRGREYGLEEIYHNWRNDTQVPLQYSLRAIGHVDVLVIPTALIEKYVLGPDRNSPLVSPDLLPRKLSTPTAQTSVPGSEVGSPRIGDEFLEFLVGNRFINGSATMLIDLDRCTRCDDCVRACASTHDNNPRFIRHGYQSGKYMVANACMHCADPVCLIGCPTGAIQRERLGGQVVINDTICIGCTICANSCPYNNIRMVEIRNKKGDFILDAKTHNPILKATKCDLCSNQPGGPACQRACPHDALIRMDIQGNPAALAEWMQR
ncbi:MAG: cyclic nucleotide-binding domain-containing protein [SAR324 cluster bacterium]|nr:cyclic nucleotide-binding domain-containing protein [SAR324 cluster bacterium]